MVLRKITILSVGLLVLIATLSAQAKLLELPFDKLSSGTSPLAFQSGEVDEPGLQPLGASMVKGEVTLYALDAQTGIIWIFAGKSAPRQLTQVLGRDVRGFGSLSSGEFFLLTTDGKKTLIERFNSRGRRYEHLKVKLELESDSIATVEFDGKDGFVIMSQDRGYTVDRWGHAVEPVEGYPLINSKESINFEFEDGHIDIHFRPSEKSQRVRLPLFYKPDHVEFFRTTRKGLYFLIETELNFETYESTFFIYKVQAGSRRQTAGMFVNLPYNSIDQRFFWFDDEGNIYLTTLSKKDYATWWIGNF